MDIAANAEKALRFVRESREISYDTETSGLDWKRNHPVGYIVGAPEADGSIRPDNVVYVPVRHGGGGNLAGCRPLVSPEEGFETHPWEHELARAFNDRNLLGLGRIVGHHTKFDCHFSANAGVMLGRRMACTQNQEAMLDEYAKSFSLDSCAERHGVTAKKGEELYQHMAQLFGGPATRAQMQHFWRLPGNDPIAVDYAEGDGVSTWELYVKQCAKIREEEMQMVADLENDLIWVAFRMERKGIKIDLNRVHDLRKATEQAINELLRKFPPGFNTRSGAAVKRAMEEAGHTDWPKTDKGNPSFTEKWLKKTEIGRDIVQIRRHSNLINSFINPLEERHVFKGRVHATLNQMKSDDKGTISGRFSCSAPNLQQLPKRVKEVAKPFRRLFVADEGHIFWERDYSQIEPRLYAHYTQDPNLMKGYNSVPFVDVHTMTAELLGVERDPTGKRANMGNFTGLQPKGFADYMGWELDKATRLWNAWHSAYPGVKKFQETAKIRLAQRGYVFSILGRRQRLEEKRFAYRGASKVIQSSNAEVLKYKLLQMDRVCEDNGDIVQVLMVVHDSFEGQRQDTPEGKVLLEELIRIGEDVQGEPFNMSVPCILEGDEGHDWAEATWGA